ncbi:MAG: flagellar motor switch protein FliM [Acidobacteria bacterium]|nr:flagellar motor switch protein FliM [Acidobacteriota bacterium]
MVGVGGAPRLPPDRILTQDEIDRVFLNLQDSGKSGEPGGRAQSYDFRRPDRIAKDQLRSIHVLHDNFCRGLASSLSAYLRAYVMVNLVSVEQLSYMEFSRCLPSPTCLTSLGMRPFDGNAVLELNPALVFPVLEMLLGGSGKSAVKMSREITEIEQSVLEGLQRIILHDLKEAWNAVANIDFVIEKHETEPQLLQILAPNEAVVAISIEVRVGETSGMMNLGLPSIIVKMLRQKFDQRWSIRKSESSEDEQARILRLIKPALLRLDARLQGPRLTVDDMLQLKEGDVLALDYPTDRNLDCLVNGKLKLKGRIVSTDRLRAFRADRLHRPAD